MLFNQLFVLSFVLLGSPRRFREGDGVVSANIGKLRGMANKKVQIHVDCWLRKFGMVFFFVGNMEKSMKKRCEERNLLYFCSVRND